MTNWTELEYSRSKMEGFHQRKLSKRNSGEVYISLQYVVALKNSQNVLLDVMQLTTTLKYLCSLVLWGLWWRCLTIGYAITNMKTKYQIDVICNSIRSCYSSCVFCLSFTCTWRSKWLYWMLLGIQEGDLVSSPVSLCLSPSLSSIVKSPGWPLPQSILCLYNG